MNMESKPDCEDDRKGLSSDGASGQDTDGVHCAGLHSWVQLGDRRHGESTVVAIPSMIDFAPEIELSIPHKQPRRNPRMRLPHSTPKKLQHLPTHTSTLPSRCMYRAI